MICSVESYTNPVALDQKKDSTDQMLTEIYTIHKSIITINTAAFRCEAKFKPLLCHLPHYMAMGLYKKRKKYCMAVYMWIPDCSNR